MATPDPGWLERLDASDVSRCGAALRKLTRALVGDLQRAEDVSQEAWLRAVQGPPRSPAALASWLQVVARRLAGKERRATESRARREARAARPELGAAPDEVLERIEEERRVLDLVSALAEPYRTTVFLRYWSDLPPRLIARRSGCSVETVKTRLGRGLALLRAALDGRTGGRRDAWRLALLPIAFPGGAGSTAGMGGGLAAPVAIGVGLAMKKVLVAISCGVLVLAGLYFGLPLVGSALRPTRVRVPELEAALAGGPRASEAPRLEPVEAVAPEGAGERREREAAPPPATGGLDVRLSWSDGTPAADVTIEALCAADPATRDEPFRARTDGSGRALFPALFPGSVQLDVDRGGRFEALVEAGATREVHETLPAAESVRGAVRDRAGRPVAGAEIWLDPGWGWVPHAYRVATTASDGTFELRDVGGGSRIGARATGYPPSPTYQVDALGVANDRRELVLVLEAEASGSIAGLVVDPDGRPVAGAAVKIGPRGGWSSGDFAHRHGHGARAAKPVAVICDEDGTFRYPGGLPPGTQPVHASARGWPVWSGTVDVQAGVESELEIVLEPPATVTGTVVDPTGIAVEGIEVVASEEFGGGWHQDELPAPRGKSDAGGRFRLECLAPGDRMLVAQDHQRPEIGRALGRVECVGGSTVEVRLTLDLGLTVQGRLADADGRALVGWRVRAESSGLLQQVYPRRSGPSGPGGEFVVPNLDPSARYDLEAVAPGEWRGRAKLERVEPGARDLVLVVQDTDVASGRVRGRLLDGAGRAPRELELVLWPANVNAGEFVDFDADSGAFDHGPLRAGRYVLRATRAGQTVTSSETFEVGGGETVDVGPLVVESTGRIALVVRGVPESELASLRLSIDRPGHSTEGFELRAGRFESRELAAGVWTVALGLGGGWFLGQHQVDVPAGGVTTLELDAVRGVKVPVTCRLADVARAGAGARPWKGLRYAARDRLGVPIWTGVLADWNDDGSGNIPGLALPEGDYWIEVETASGLRGRASVVVRGPSCAEPVEIEVR